jgi:Zn-dependent oligopeptidase
LFQSTVNSHFLSETSLFKAGICHVLPLSEEEINAVTHLFQNLKQYQNQPEIVAAQTLTLIEMVEFFRQKNQTKRAFAQTRAEILLHNFDALL